MTKQSRQPLARSESVSSRMSLQRERNTGIELRLRRELHRRGLRYRLHQRLIPGLRREADITFRGARVAVFVDGCFWHSCPLHGTIPANNREWWENKLAGNRERDADTDARLRDEGWVVVRIWEHEDAGSAADRVQEIVTSPPLRGRTTPHGRKQERASERAVQQD